MWAKTRLLTSLLIPLLFLVFVVWVFPPVILGILTALLAAGFIGPIWPGVADLLSNKPNRFRLKGDTERDYRKDNFGFFTPLQPGRVKMIERGESFVRAIMDWDGKAFKGELPGNTLRKDEWEYWDVVDSGDNPDSHPIQFPTPSRDEHWAISALYAPGRMLFWLWKRWVYTWTGYVFTGIPPYQTVRTYPMERFKLHIDTEGNTQLVRVLDYSDHYRVAEFQFPTTVPRADSQDMIEVKWTINQIGRVTNPFKIAYNTDDNWTARHFAAISNAATSVSRARPADKLLSATNLLGAQQLGEEISTLTNLSVMSFGVDIVRTEIIDVTPTDPEKARRLGDLAIAMVDRKAAEERAVGLAAPIREQGTALRAFPEAALIPQNEAMVRAAAAAGDKAIVILGDSKGISTGQAAILKEIREISRERKGTTP